MSRLVRTLRVRRGAPRLKARTLVAIRPRNVRMRTRRWLRPSSTDGSERAGSHIRRRSGCAIAVCGRLGLLGVCAAARGAGIVSAFCCRESPPWSICLRQSKNPWDLLPAREGLDFVVRRP